MTDVMRTAIANLTYRESNTSQRCGPADNETEMSLNTYLFHRLAARAIAAVIATTTLAGLATVGEAHAAPAMAKCIPGSGNPWNTCPKS